MPERAAPVVAAAVNCTTPLPDPGLPLVMEIQSAWLEAVHVHPPGAVTLTVPVPPADGTVCDCGLMANVQPCAWVTRTLFSATVTDPFRPGPVDGATCSVTVPLPLPDDVPI